MKIRFFNANILMLDEKNDFVLGEVCVLDNTIIYVGKEKNKSFLADREINVFGNILMPGFVNAHAHSAMTLFRGVCDDAGLDEWLNDNIVPMEKNLQKNDVYWGTKLAILEQFSAGITTCEDLYFRKEESIKAFVELGQRARIGLGFLGNGENDGEEDVKNFASLKHDLISFVLYAHSIYSCSENEFEKLVAFSKKFRLPVSTHLSETLKEV
ncbi:MAG: amidohydrolase family protein, partial [Clostridia bacterium]